MPQDGAPPQMVAVVLPELPVGQPVSVERAVPQWQPVLRWDATIAVEAEMVLQIPKPDVRTSVEAESSVLDRSFLLR